MGLDLVRAAEVAVASVLNEYGIRAGLHPLVWTLDDVSSASAIELPRTHLHGCPAEDLGIADAMLVAEQWVRVLPWDRGGREDGTGPQPTEKDGARRWNGRVDGVPIEIWAIVELGVWEDATTF